MALQNHKTMLVLFLFALPLTSPFAGADHADVCTAKHTGPAVHGVQGLEGASCAVTCPGPDVCTVTVQGFSFPGAHLECYINGQRVGTSIGPPCEGNMFNVPAGRTVTCHVTTIGPVTASIESEVHCGASIW